MCCVIDRSDKTLEDIIYKLVPKLQESKTVHKACNYKLKTKPTDLACASFIFMIVGEANLRKCYPSQIRLSLDPGDWPHK